MEVKINKILQNISTAEKVNRNKTIKNILRSRKYLSLRELIKASGIPRTTLYGLLNRDFNGIIENKIINGQRYIKLINNRLTKIEILKKERDVILKDLYNLRKEGLSYSELREASTLWYGYKISNNILSKEFSRIQINQKGQQRLLEKIKKDRGLAGKESVRIQKANGRDFSKCFENCRYDATKPIKKQDKTMKPKKARLIGHCMFDGYVSDININQYGCICYTSKIKEQVESFRDLIREIYDLEPSLEIREGQYVSRCCSKEAVRDLIRYTPNYSTREGTKAEVPKEILNGNNEIKKEFLRAFWDDEGCIVCLKREDKKRYAHFKKQLEGSTENDVVREGLLQIHNDLGINIKNWGKKIIINGEEDLKRFKENIGFSRYAEVTKNKRSLWLGVKKYRILDHAIRTYKKTPLFYLKTYGCSANKADSNSISNVLEKVGFKETEDLNKADMVFVNSCGVKGVTQNKILSMIKELSKKNTVIVGGCLTKIIDIPQSINKNIKIFDTNTILKLPYLIFSDKDKVTSTKKEDRLNTIIPRGNEKEAFTITISQGCLGSCTYCATKFARGSLKSYKKEEIVNKVKEALDKGYSRINLTSTDNGCYGFDKGYTLIELLKDILKLKENFKLRIGMANPSHLKKFYKKLIPLYKDKKIIPFLHIPIQSGSDKVLKEMKRNHTIKQFEDIAKAFRKEIPNITISTDIIVGYPTETDKDFQQTLDLIKKLKFEVINISKYASRPNTVASKLKQLPSQVIKQRSVKATKAHKASPI